MKGDHNCAYLTWNQRWGQSLVVGFPVLVRGTGGNTKCFTRQGGGGWVRRAHTGGHLAGHAESEVSLGQLISFHLLSGL